MPNPEGRPPIEWTKERQNLFEALMGIPFVTEEAVADVMGISISTLQRRLKSFYEMSFDQIKEQKREGMKLKLAGKQYELAMKGNVPLLIWLGKNMLGQTDKQEIAHDVSNITIKIDKDDSSL